MNLLNISCRHQQYSILFRYQKSYSGPVPVQYQSLSFYNTIKTYWQSIFQNLMSINLKYEAMQQPLKMEPWSQKHYQMAALLLTTKGKYFNFFWFCCREVF